MRGRQEKAHISGERSFSEVHVGRITKTKREKVAVRTRTGKNGTYVQKNTRRMHKTYRAPVCPSLFVNSSTRRSIHWLPFRCLLLPSLPPLSIEMTVSLLRITCSKKSIKLKEQSGPREVPREEGRRSAQPSSVTQQTEVSIQITEDKKQQSQIQSGIARTINRTRETTEKKGR